MSICNANGNLIRRRMLRSPFHHTRDRFLMDSQVSFYTTQISICIRDLFIGYQTLQVASYHFVTATPRIMWSKGMKMNNKMVRIKLDLREPTSPVAEPEIQHFWKNLNWAIVWSSSIHLRNWQIYLKFIWISFSHPVFRLPIFCILRGSPPKFCM
jgi:hypothetical protein